MARLTGKNAALYISPDGVATFAWVADLYEWVAEIRLVTFASSIKGDRFDRRTQSHLEGTLTARRFVENVLANLALANLIVGANNVIAAGPSFAFTQGNRIQFAVVGADQGFPAGGNAANFTSVSTLGPKIQGTGYITRAHVGAPRERIEDDFEMILDTLVSMA
jgi:hypothetical protein